MHEGMKNKTVLVTGATGLIGQALVKRLLCLDTKVLAIVRNIDKAKKILGDDKRISYIVGDITEIEIKSLDIDFIIHGASNTSSKAFVNNPVGVINTAIEGTKRTLEIASLSNVKGYVFLSSMEVYGVPTSDEKIEESQGTNLNTMVARSAYPESKRLCESLCTAYESQYKVPTKVVRLTQTFGPGVQYNDGRVFAEFARCVIEGRDIILHTKGETKRSYLYTEDAVDAILTVLTNGTIGEAYNAANEDTYCSILDLAYLFAGKSADHPIDIKFDIEQDLSHYGYAPVLRMNLSTEKLCNLGWRPCFQLPEMIDSLIEDMKKRIFLS